MGSPPNPKYRIQCSMRGCHVTFTRMPDMARHRQEFHGILKVCPQPGCKYSGTKRRHRLQAHMQKNHPHLFNVPLHLPHEPQLGGSTLLMPGTPSQSAMPLQSHQQVLQDRYSERGNTGPRSQQSIPTQTTPNLNSSSNHHTINDGHDLQETQRQWRQSPSQPSWVPRQGNPTTLNGTSNENGESGFNLAQNGEAEEEFEREGQEWSHGRHYSW